MKTKNYFSKASILLLVFVAQFITAQIPSYVPINGLVAYYPFLGNANDESGNGNNGIVNGATLTNDILGNSNSAYSFNGVSNNIGLSQPFLGGSQVNSFSFFIRFKPNGTPSTNNVYNIWGKSFYWGEVNLAYTSNNNINIIWANSNGGNTYTHIQTNTSINPNTWINAVITFENSQVKIYIEGVLQSVTDYYGTNSLCNFAQDANSSKIGSRITGGVTGNYFNGIIDDFGVWNRALNQTEINNLTYVDSTCQTLVINTGVLSLNPPTFQNTVTIYPNPANDHITIDCGNLSNVSGWHVVITNTLGQEIFNQPMNTQQYVVPLNSWTGQGVYFVKIYDASNNLMNTKKIILQ